MPFRHLQQRIIVAIIDRQRLAWRVQRLTLHFREQRGEVKGAKRSGGEIKFLHCQPVGGGENLVAKHQYQLMGAAKHPRIAVQA
ncbi:hypothetical protein D3C81_1127920 [compost metagenome]